jgi:fatty acid desaturase
MTSLTEWGNFYVIVGSSAGALVGLQFVVMTLIAGRPVERGEAQASDAFSTPIVVHFGVVLLLSAIAGAPWDGVGALAVLWGLAGLGGIVYTAVVARRMRAQKAYRPVFEDWLFHVLLPLAAYAMLAGSAFAARPYTRPALFVVGATALLLLFVGIHNAWDTVTHLVFVMRRERQEDEQDR